MILSAAVVYSCSTSNVVLPATTDLVRSEILEYSADRYVEITYIDSLKTIFIARGRNVIVTSSLTTWVGTKSDTAQVMTSHIESIRCYDCKKYVGEGALIGGAVGAGLGLLVGGLLDMAYTSTMSTITLGYANTSPPSSAAPPAAAIGAGLGIGLGAVVGSSRKSDIIWTVK